MSIECKNLNYTYGIKTPQEFQALKDINLKLEDGKITAFVGHTGSGKTTLVQHFNGLLLPTNGSITVNDYVFENNKKPKNLKALRKEVGLVFQFPEYQLFEETIEKDICFGPKNFNMSDEDIEQSLHKVCEIVGIDKDMLMKSPLELSGGQKRRVAIAGILAMNPSILVLDEPTSGLDPQGAKYMMNMFKELNTKLNKTIILVTHDMEHVLNYCDNVVVLKKGEIILQSDVNEFFENEEVIKKLNVELPNVIKTRNMLREKGLKLPGNMREFEDLIDAIKEEVGYE